MTSPGESCAVCGRSDDDPGIQAPHGDPAEPGARILGDGLQYDVPRFVTELLLGVGREIERIETNRQQAPYVAPTSWDANHEYTTSAFVMRGFSYDDARPQFTTTTPTGQSLMLRWYKHLGRSMTANLELTPAGWVNIYDRCITELHKLEPGPAHDGLS